MDTIRKLLSANKQWAKRQVEVEPDFFEKLEKLQNPEILWIGCSDSRVPANEITDTKPGEIFVHRNVANLVIHTDLNLLSVLHYSVVVLHVKHIIVCGHYGCGGVKAAMTHQSFGILNKWLRNIKDVYRIHQQEVDALATEEERLNRMAELNVKEQVMNLAKTSIVQKSWAEHGIPHIHGWIYSLHDGIIKAIEIIPPGTTLDSVYQFDSF
ncbi:MAG: carbonic anhydrase [Bacteroidetes bacterium]|nr:carbonic anhydrase [Bacteroidota bacterium]